MTLPFSGTPSFSFAFARAVLASWGKWVRIREAERGSGSCGSVSVSEEGEGGESSLGGDDMVAFI